jgi:hypothetical protein
MCSVPRKDQCRFRSNVDLGVSLAAALDQPTLAATNALLAAIFAVLSHRNDQ